MPALEQILAIFKTLSLAYPEKKLDEPTLQLYMEQLADIPVNLLWRAVKEHIQTSDWFPKISELRKSAARLAGTNQFESLAPHPVELLLEKAIALEDAYYQQGILDSAAWQSLAEAFERADRPYRAEATRRKLAMLQLSGDSNRR
jgi:hypothetical protein